MIFSCITSTVVDRSNNHEKHQRMTIIHLLHRNSNERVKTLPPLKARTLKTMGIERKWQENWQTNQ